MKLLSLERVARALGADLVGGEGSAVVRGAAIDSRGVREGDLFFALRGRVDGADFAPEAHLRGAAATVAGRPLEVPTLVVEEPLAALRELARWSLREYGASEGPAVVGITGSVGKTTTKDALAAILRSAGKRVSATEGNFNNEIGLPLTVLGADPRTEVMVLEMGATHTGDVRRLCEISPPGVGILTAVAPVHLDSFGSLEALARAKGELADAVPDDGTFVAPTDVPASATGPGRGFRRITFSAAPGEPADLWASGVEEHDEGLRFVVHAGYPGSEERSAEVRAPVFGTHLVRPLLAAVGGALALGLELEECARGVARVKRTGLRGEVYRLRGDVVVYDDSYNASPTAVEAVLRYGAEQAGRGGRRLVAVLGGMFELGPGAREYHREAGHTAEEVGVDLLVCVGEEARWYAEGFGGRTLFYDAAETAAKGLVGALEHGDYVLVKGSRGVELDGLTRRLKETLALA